MVVSESLRARSLRFAAALLVLEPRSARADDAAESDQTSAQSELDRSGRFSFGPRLMVWRSDSAVTPAGGLGLGFDGSYLFNPNFGVGAQVLAYTDFLMLESHPLSLGGGVSALAFAEERLPLTSFLAPYARGGAGCSFLGLQEGRAPYRDGPRRALALTAEAGIELHYVVSLRLFGTSLFHPTVSQAAAVYGYGAQLGVRF